MCGLVGIFNPDIEAPAETGRLMAMIAAIRHRGPDGEGVMHKPGIALGHRRLAIVDLDNGAQPMASDDGDVTVVFNGMIYNFRELRAELETQGHRFRTHSDTEVLVHGYRQWGAKLTDRLRGMFAFAVFDAADDSLFLARDRLGEKPLYYGRRPDGTWVFGSEIGAVVAGFGGPPPIEPTAVADYFTYGYVPDPKSIYRDIAKLAPGHRLRLSRDCQQARPERYWRPRFRNQHRGSLADLAHELAERVREAVELRMIADVPLGAFLSGGVDSSGVVALMAQASSQPVVTCTIGFTDSQFDESAYARRLATRYATDHHEEIVDLDAAALLDRLPSVYGEPFADSSALPTYVVSQVARRHVTVALTGDGGDEVFAGYRRYPFHCYEERVKAWLPAGLRRLAFGPLARAWPKLDWAPRPLRAKATLEALATDTVQGYARAVTILPETERQRLFTEEFKRELAGYDPTSVLAAHAVEADTDDPLARAQYMDLMTWLPGRMLVKTDRASMAHALELRPPLLDHELVEWACGLPSALKLRGHEGKAILKQAFESFVPHELLYRPKQGFTLPLAGWLREGSHERVQVLGTTARAPHPYINRNFVAEAVSQHRRGLRDYTPLLWAALMLKGFLDSGSSNQTSSLSSICINKDKVAQLGGSSIVTGNKW